MTDREISAMLVAAGLVGENEEPAWMKPLVDWLDSKRLSMLEIILTLREAVSAFSESPEEDLRVSLLGGVNQWGAAIVFSRQDTMFVPALARTLPRAVKPVMIDTIDLGRLLELTRSAGARKTPES